MLVEGTNAKGIAKFMDEQLDVWQAIKFDGGGSSQLYYGGFPASQSVVYRGDGRWLSQYLGILAHSGNGIDLESSPPSEPPPDDTDLNWWQKIQKVWNDFWKWVGGSISNWWQEKQRGLSSWLDNLKKKIAEALDAWWKDLQRKIAAWFEQQLAQWLNQWCGTAELIPVSIAIVIYSRRRRSQK